MKKILISAGVVLASGVAAVAGGLADAIVEQEPMAMAEAVETGGSLPGWLIPVAVFAGLALLATSSTDDEPEYSE